MTETEMNIDLQTQIQTETQTQTQPTQQGRQPKLWNKDFIKFVIGWELTLIGSALIFFALPLYVLLETGNPALLFLVVYRQRYFLPKKTAPGISLF